MDQQGGWEASFVPPEERQRYAKFTGQYREHHVSSHWFRRTARARAKELERQEGSVRGRVFFVRQSRRGPYKWEVVEHDYSEFTR